MFCLTHDASEKKNALALPVFFQCGLVRHDFGGCREAKFAFRISTDEKILFFCWGWYDKISLVLFLIFFCFAFEYGRTNVFAPWAEAE